MDRTPKLNLLSEALPRVKDLMKADPAIYWKDYAFCTVLGWACFILSLQPSFPVGVRAALLLAAGFGLYRSAIFIHELAHLRKSAVPYFNFVWNLFSGIPLLIPSFIYTDVHINHHRATIYGTERDGEYYPFEKMGKFSLFAFVFANLFFPLALIVRHLVLTPLSFVSPKVRMFTWRYVSSLALKLDYRRPDPKTEHPLNWQEVSTFFFVLAMTLGFAFGVLPSSVFFQWYCIAMFVLVINAVRTLVAHRYSHGDDQMLTVDEQYLDSIDIPGNVFTALWAPVGLRWHATHHLLPGVPYHNLAEAHRRLVAALVENHDTYLRATRPNMWVALRELYHAAGSHRAPKAAAEAVN